ncbi:hypothetical protein QJQ45_012526 [Haematococcus lacustris]|nr:hypothetical protein QJQ45_012526 [Haematococcus lacustris]
MDSPSVNRAALYLLERDNPTWICMTCCVHAMNLICTDLANESKTLEKHVAVDDFLKQVQRNWSVWGHTYHNALRNNLSVEAAKREVYLKANVPSTDSDDDAPTVQDTLIDIMK